ncbi:MAG TPA: hypothetical protein VM658_09580 [bacterium]|nr:hypothetical protein [bacterium]
MRTSGPKQLTGTSRILPQHDPDVLETRSGGGCLSLFGLPFLLAGLFTMQIPLRLVPVENSDNMPWFFFFLFGLVFATAGGVLVFGRSGLILDRRTGMAVKWWGLLLPMKRREYPLDTLKTVSIHKNVGDSDSPTTYPVQITGEDGGKRISVTNPTDYAQARCEAEQLAKFLGLPVADTSSGKKVVREAGELDESVRDRARRTGEKSGYLPDPPFNMRTRVQETGDGVVLEIPGPPLNVTHYLSLGAATVVSLIALFFLFSNLEPSDLAWPPSPQDAAIAGLILIFFVAAPILSALAHVRRDRNRSTRVIASPALLRVEERVKGKLVTTEIPGDQLEELTLPTLTDATAAMNAQSKRPAYELGDTGVMRMPDGRPMPGILVTILKMAGSPGIVARSDTATVTFGAGLSEAELRYLQALILKAMTQ